MPRRRAPAWEEQKENRHHENAGEGDAERDQDTELRKSARPRQHQGEKANRCRERPEENRLAQIFHGLADGGRMIFAVITRLLVAAENQDREIDSEADEDRAKARRLGMIGCSRW